MERELRHLEGVGKACLGDFEKLGIKSVAALSKRNPEKMYSDLCQLTGQAQDICVLDVFRCAVAQAQNPQLPEDDKKWWNWSKRRKSEHKERLRI